MIPRSLRSMRRNIQKVRCHCFLSSLSFFLFVFEFNFKWFILSIGLELKLFFEGFSNYYCFIFIFLWSLICFFVLFFLAAKNEVLYVAIDDHAAQSDDDLMFLKGELITVTRRLNEIMWEVSFFLSFFFFFFSFVQTRLKHWWIDRVSVRESAVSFLPSWWSLLAAQKARKRRPRLVSLSVLFTIFYCCKSGSFFVSSRISRQDPPPTARLWDSPVCAIQLEVPEELEPQFPPQGEGHWSQRKCDQGTIDYSLFLFLFFFSFLPSFFSFFFFFFSFLLSSFSFFFFWSMKLCTHRSFTWGCQKPS